MLNNAESFIIGFMLIMGPCTAYDIVKRAGQSPLKSITGGAGIIYPAIKSLGAKGCLVGESVREGSRPEKRVWRLTETGMTEFLGWVATPVSPDQYRHFHAVFELKCVHSFRLRPRALASFATRQTTILEQYRGQLMAYRDSVAAAGPLSIATVNGIIGQVDYDLALLKDMVRGASTGSNRSS